MRRREFLKNAAAFGAVTALGMTGLRSAFAAEGAAAGAAKLARGVSALPVIDAHIHFSGDHPETIKLIRELNVRMVNIAGAGRGRGWRQRADGYRKLADAYPDVYEWISGFELPPLEADKEYADRAIAEIDEDFKAGCIALKVVKNVGLDLKDKDGNFIQIDNPAFHPIFEHLQKMGYPICLHVAEPKAAWLPLDPNNAHYHYYSKNERYHMFGKTGYPSHEEIIAARDHVLEMFPKLRVIGAHLGSMEYDLKVMADHFDKYPNLAVDTSARMYDLTYYDGSAVRDFVTKYQDRLIFGLDVGYRQPAEMGPEQIKEVDTLLRDAYQREYDYYGGTEPVLVNVRTIPGIGVSEKVMRKLFYENALKWYPALRA